jgi:transcriptional regulator with XRE-family HTH domain
VVALEGGLVSVGIGARLRTIRHQWQLSLREVEERSLRFAQEQGNLAYKVSASWLNRLEREAHELSVNKLIALAQIYNLPTKQLLDSICPGDPQLVLRQISSPNATMLKRRARLSSKQNIWCQIRVMPIIHRMKQGFFRLSMVYHQSLIDVALSGEEILLWSL